MRKLLFGLAVAAAASAITYRYAFLPWFRSWGVVPADTARTLPGDEIVPGAQAGETRSIVIDAAPAAIWPWLVQMGFGRGGWYSYEPMNMSGTNSTEINPDFQSLAVGDVMPTHPGGGFEVRILEPERALVLYSDTAMVQAQFGAAQMQSGATAEDAADAIEDAAAAVENFEAAWGDAAAEVNISEIPEFEASWAFVLEPVGDGQTKLIERFRVRFGETDKPWTRYTLPMVGFGVFMMMRKQLLGIKQRVEQPATPVKALA